MRRLAVCASIVLAGLAVGAVPAAAFVPPPAASRSFIAGPVRAGAYRVWFAGVERVNGGFIPNGVSVKQTLEVQFVRVRPYAYDSRNVVLAAHGKPWFHSTSGGRAVVKGTLPGAAKL